jgi:hypothetical protein
MTQHAESIPPLQLFEVGDFLPRSNSADVRTAAVKAIETVIHSYRQDYGRAELMPAGPERQRYLRLNAWVQRELSRAAVIARTGKDPGDTKRASEPTTEQQGETP